MSDSPVPSSDSPIPPRSDADQYEKWVSVYNGSTDYAADLVRDRLDDAGMPAVILTHRDHNFNLNVGDLTGVHVMVPPQHAEEARRFLREETFTDAELEEAAMNADPESGDAHGEEMEAMLDSAVDEINLSLPDEIADPERAARRRRERGEE
jgi:hypothetical protein